MEKLRGLVVLLILPILLGACAPMISPTVAAYPGSGKSMDDFRKDDVYCRQVAEQKVDPTGEMLKSVATRAAIGAVIGGAGGAIAGVGVGDVAAGAAIGAGTGMTAGGLIGAGTGIPWEVQQRYNVEYQQCMYLQGHKVQYTPTMQMPTPAPDIPSATPSKP